MNLEIELYTFNGDIIWNGILNTNNIISELDNMMILKYGSDKKYNYIYKNKIITQTILESFDINELIIINVVIKNKFMQSIVYMGDCNRIRHDQNFNNSLPLIVFKNKKIIWEYEITTELWNYDTHGCEINNLLDVTEEYVILYNWASNIIVVFDIDTGNILNTCKIGELIIGSFYMLPNNKLIVANDVKLMVVSINDISTSETNEISIIQIFAEYTDSIYYSFIGDPKFNNDRTLLCYSYYSDVYLRSSDNYNIIKIINSDVNYPFYSIQYNNLWIQCKDTQLEKEYIIYFIETNETKYYNNENINEYIKINNITPYYLHSEIFLPYEDGFIYTHNNMIYYTEDDIGSFNILPENTKKNAQPIINMKNITLCMHLGVKYLTIRGY
jgi:hypothetical protein